MHTTLHHGHFTSTPHGISQISPGFLGLPKTDTWEGAIIIGFAFPILFVIIFSLAKYVWHHIVIAHDVSALAYLGNYGCLEKPAARRCKDSSPFPPDFENCPIYPDNQRYYQVRDKTLTNNNPHDIVGFVVGKPKWLQDPPHQGDPGYYAELIILWDQTDNLRQWVKRGYAIQLANLLDDDVADLSRLDSRYLAISPFPDPEDGKSIVDAITKTYECRTFRCRPYKKYGFSGEEIDSRQLSWQVASIRWLAKKISSAYH